MAAGFSSPGQNCVPKFDIFGHAHHRNPYEDKSHLLTTGIGHATWLGAPPAVRTRSELFSARRRGNRPDATYDFDGDGVVGQLDFKVGRAFDKDCDGRLTASERGRAEKALEDGFLQKHTQARVPLSIEEPSTATHWRSRHPTKTALEMTRQSEAREIGSAVLDRYCSSLANVPDPPHPDAQSSPKTAFKGSMRQRAEAKNSQARIRGGLLPAATATNPERELREGPGLGYEEAPAFGSQSALLETRREGMKTECEMLAHGRQGLVPLAVRVTAKEALAHDFRGQACGEHAATRTKMVNARRKEHVEYLMHNFELRPPQRSQYPKFSERPGNVPFWLNDIEHAARSAPVSPVKRMLSEPTFKITETFSAPSSPSAPAGGSPSPQGQQGAPATGGQSKDTKSLKTGNFAKKRFSDENRKQPRLFGHVRPIAPTTNDLRDLDEISSLEPVRDAAMQKKRGVYATGEPRRSELWREEGQPRTPPPPSTPQPGTAPAYIEPSVSQKIDVPPREPRYFGTLSKSMSSPTLAGTHGIRCSGFQSGRPLPERGQRTLKAGALAI